jgi:hypothetical protein
MSTATQEPPTKIDLVDAVRRATPQDRAAVLGELVRIQLDKYKGEAPMLVWNDEGLVTAILVPCAKPFDPNAHTRDPDREEIIRREMEEVIKREGPPLRLHELDSTRSHGPTRT